MPSEIKVVGMPSCTISQAVSRALEKGTCLVGNHFNFLPMATADQENPQCSAMASRCQRSRIAVGEHAVAVLQ